MIVLTILKWIGIVLGWFLLGLLALALLILLLVLFVPFRYTANVSTGEIEGSKVAYGFGITWILHAISVRKKIDSDKIVIRILGIPIKKIGGEKIQDSETVYEYEGEDIYAEEEEPETEPDIAEMNASVGDGKNTREWTIDGGKEPEIQKTVEETEESAEADVAEEKEEEPAEEEKKSRKEKKREQLAIKSEKKLGPIERLFKAIRDKIEGIKKKILGSFKKIGFIFYKLSSIIELVKDRTPRQTVKRLVKEVVRMIRYVGPKKFKGTVEFGTGDPSSTGLILGGVSLCKLAYQKDVSITPNFEEKCLVGNAMVKGRIRVVYFVRMALRIWFDKDVHRLWRRYRRMKKDFRKKERALQS